MSDGEGRCWGDSTRERASTACGLLTTPSLWEPRERPSVTAAASAGAAAGAKEGRSSEIVGCFWDVPLKAFDCFLGDDFNSVGTRSQDLRLPVPSAASVSAIRAKLRV